MHAVPVPAPPPQVSSGSTAYKLHLSQLQPNYLCISWAQIYAKQFLHRCTTTAPRPSLELCDWCITTRLKNLIAMPDSGNYNYSSMPRPHLLQSECKNTFVLCFCLFFSDFIYLVFKFCFLIALEAHHIKCLPLEHWLLHRLRNRFGWSFRFLFLRALDSASVELRHVNFSVTNLKQQQKRVQIV